MPKERKSWLLISWIMTSLSRFFTLIFRNMSRLPLSGQKAEFDTIQWGDHFSSATILASGNTAHTTNERPVSRSRDDSRPMRVATHRTLAWWRDRGHYTGATNCNLLQMQITKFGQNMQRQCPLWHVAGPQWPDTSHCLQSRHQRSDTGCWLLSIHFVIFEGSRPSLLWPQESNLMSITGHQRGWDQSLIIIARPD